jgi:hypothetical protein
MGKLSAAAIIVLAIPALAAAQHRGGGGPAMGASFHGAAAGPVMAAPFRGGGAIAHSAFAPARSTMRVVSGTQSAARIGSPILRARNNGVRIIHRNNSNPFVFDGVNDFQDVPGLGFDYPHLAAISGNHHRHANRFFAGDPFGFGGGFLWGPSVVVEEVPAAESQPVVIEDQVADDTSDTPRPSRRARASREVSDPLPASTVASAPQPDPEQFVFVRRDGGLVFAVAYTWDNGTLRYVTPEGVRRSMGRDALDLSATQQFNEQRGLNFRVPA